MRAKRETRQMKRRLRKRRTCTWKSEWEGRNETKKKNSKM